IIGRLCPEGWLYSKHTKYCYHLVTIPTTFNNAQFACRLQNAHLLSIHSEAEDRFISDNISVQVKTIFAKYGQSIWLGAAIFDNSRKYEYVDSTPFDYTNWQNGTQPIYKKSRKCVKISSENWKWFDDCCYYRPVSYVCKKLAGKYDQSHWKTIVNKTSKIKNNHNHRHLKLFNYKFSNEKSDIVIKENKRRNKVSDMVASFANKIYDNKMRDKLRTRN
uniref:C-type lectin domain-containing protein n=1 Tax=Wuchereria bancrofti TaxID=6293 RepID=A0A1I8EAF0_WUCBA